MKYCGMIFSCTEKNTCILHSITSRPKSWKK